MAVKNDILETILEEIDEDTAKVEAEVLEEAEKGVNPFAKKDKKDKKDDDDEDKEDKDDDDEDKDDDDEDKDDPVENKHYNNKEPKKEENKHHHNKEPKKESVKVSEELEIDVKEDVDAILKGTKLSAEHQKKVATIFETALRTQVRKHVQKAEEFYEEKYSADLKEQVLVLENKIDEYMEHVADKWLEENELAVEQGVRADLVESFIRDLKIVCENHNIEFSDEELSEVAESRKTIAELETKLDESIKSEIEIRKTLRGSQMQLIVSGLSEGLVETDKEKFISLIEDVEFGSVEEYTEKLKTIKDNYFSNDGEIIVEDSDIEFAGSNNTIKEKDLNTLTLVEQAVLALKNQNNR